MFTVTVAPDRVVPSAAALQPKLWLTLAGLVHDLRQPLSVIETSADYLNLVLPPGDLEARAQIEVLREQVEDASRLLCEAVRMLQQSDRAELTNAASAAVTY